MQELKARSFVNAVRALATVELALTKASPHEKTIKIPPEASGTKKTLRDLQEFADACGALGAHGSKIAAEELIAKLNSGESTLAVLHEEVRHLHKYFERHLISVKLFAINQDESKFFDAAVTAFGDDVLDAFPLIASEIDEAGKCIALGRAPAAVFHLMRVVEIGLRALAPLVGIDSQNPDWGTVIRKIDDELKLPKDKRTLNMDYDFLAGVSSHMHAVKLAWRNQVMHVDATFSLDNGRDIFNGTKALMQHLASGLAGKANP